MNKALRWIVPAGALAIVIAVAVLLYPRLAVRYRPETEATAANEPAAAAAESNVPEADAQEGSGAPAPDFEVTDADGAAVRLSDYAGKPVVINFWATWCPPCRSELPSFDALYAEYGDRVEFMMVNLTDGSRDTVSGVQDFVAEEGFTFPVYYDTAYSAADAYQIYSIPVTVFVRPDGTIAAQQIGSMQESILRAYLEDLLSE